MLETAIARANIWNKRLVIELYNARIIFFISVIYEAIVTNAVIYATLIVCIDSVLCFVSGAFGLIAAPMGHLQLCSINKHDYSTKDKVIHIYQEAAAVY